ncbi:MAG: pyridoxal phosphate-dependent aminotransferase [Gemmatimonadota bacterium]
MPLQDIPLSEYGRASLEPAPVSRMMADFAGSFRDGVDINLGVGYVNERTLPRRQVQEALAAVLDQPHRYRAALNYGGPRGSANLIESVRAFLLDGRQEGLTPQVIDRRQILVGPNGATSLLESLALLIRRGIAVVADPMYYIYCNYLQRLGYEVLAVPEDAEGLSAEGLRARLAGLGPRRDEVSFLYAITVHNPTGTVLSNRRRLELVQIAAALSRHLGRRVPLVLDRAYEDLIHDPAAERPVSSLPADELDLVFEVGTLSKILAPGLRIGYLVAPRCELVEALVQRTSDAGFSAPLVNQEIASYLLDHIVAEQVRRVNEGYRDKAQQVGAWIGEKLGAAVSARSGGQAGFYYYLTLGQVETGVDSPFFAFLMRQTGDPALDGPPGQLRPRVVYIPGAFCVHPRGELVELGRHQLRLSYGFEETARIGEALDYMAEAIAWARTAR